MYVLHLWSEFNWKFHIYKFKPGIQWEITIETIASDWRRFDLLFFSR